MSRKNRIENRRKKISKKGLPPGSPIYIGVERDGQTAINIISFNLQNVRVQKNCDLEKIKNLESDLYHWVDVTGVHNVQVVNKICKQFNIHALTEEDILNTQTRPKCDIHDDYIFSSMKMIKKDGDSSYTEEEHISLVLIKNVVISFQEVAGDVFDPIRQRYNNPESRARRKGSDYLFFLLHDIVVDNYIEVIDMMDETNEKLETEILNQFSESLLNKIQSTKNDLLYLKRIIFPLKETVLKLVRSKSSMIDPVNIRYYEDLSDHLLYCCDGIEAQQEMIVSLRDLHMSLHNNNMGNVMKVLTIVSSIFIPLTFIAGVYGMNFDHMPELRMKYAYFVVLGVMLSIALLMIYYFRKKRWL